MQISPLSFRSMTQGILFRFFMRFIALINKIGADKLRIPVQVDKLLLPAFKKLDDSNNKTRGSQYSAKIADLERLLSNATSSITGTVGIMLKSNDKEMVASAKSLKFLFKAYKGITRKSRIEQVADTTNLIQELKGEYAPDVEKLGLCKLLAELEEFHDEIDAYENAKSAEMADKTMRNSAEAKREIVVAYRAICHIIEAWILTEGIENYEDFVDHLNEIIREFSIGTRERKDNVEVLLAERK